MKRQRLLDRFLRYVAIDTTAADNTETYPSSSGQITLGQILCEELSEIGLEPIQDVHGIVMATIPTNIAYAAPCMVLNAHLDTSPETTGTNVKPQIIHSYNGGDLVLPGKTDQVIRVTDNPELNSLLGCTLITTDGRTLLGGDDKAGVAAIMELAEHFSENPHIVHGPIRLLFTCDEEIGRGVDHVDVKKLDATVCYTLDGGGSGNIDIETFSADLAEVTIQGINIHPSIAKDRMVNAIRVATEMLDQLPADESSPETTCGREGFLHPYAIEGGVAEVTLRILLRDFETARLADYARTLEEIGQRAKAQYPGCSVTLKITPQYRNLAEGLKKDPRVVEYAQLAHQRLGREPRMTVIRGGTDGAQLTAQGLPTPNLSTGQHNPHSTLEWVCLDELMQAVEVLNELVQLWAS